MPRALAKVFYAPRYEIDFPLKHPKYVVCDIEHVNAVNRMLGRGPFVTKLYDKIESKLLKLQHFFRRKS